MIAESAQAVATGLPDFCYTTNLENGKTIVVKRGESGYYKTDYEDVPADHLNARLGVTKAQEQAMYSGSAFGWNIPAADPQTWIDKGL